jgi:gliding motility-associated-like protein
MKSTLLLLVLTLGSIFTIGDIFGQITVNYSNSSTNLTLETGGSPTACGAGRFSLKGGAAVFNGCLRMTPPNFNDNFGAAWVCDPIDLDSSFRLTTSVTFGSNSAQGDGVVFVIKSTSSPNVWGGVGGNIGYHNPTTTGNPIGQSLAIEFDSFNGGPGDTGDPCSHAQLARNGDLTNKIGPQTCLLPGGANVNDGLPHDICISWDALNNVYRAYFDGALVINYSGNIRTFFTNPNQVYWGFTAGDGAATNQNNHLICSTVMNISHATNRPAPNCAPCVPPTITGSLGVCSGSTTQLTGSGTPNATSPWTSSNPAVATVNSSGLVTGVSGGTATITYTNSSGCFITATVTVNQTPVVTATPTSQTICSATAPSIALTSNVAGTTFNWTVVQSGVTGATNASGASINQTLTTTGTTTGTATYTITPTANGCPGTPIEVIITVNPSPVVTATPTSQTICSGTAPSIALTSNVTGTTFNWTVVQSGVTGATNGSGASIGQTLTATGTTAGTATYTITPTANGCPGTPINVVITINPTPVVTATPASQAICSGTAPSIALTSNVTGTTFSWTVVQSGVTGATNASGTSIAQTLTATGTTAGTATYTITPTANGCPGTPINVVITVNPIPVVTATPTSQTICSGTAPSIALTSNVTGTTFSWTVVQSGVTGATNASGATINQTLTTTGTAAGTTTYTITPTANGCPGTPIDVVITVNPSPVVTATPTSQIICSGTAPSIALTSNVTGTTFSWTVVQTGVTGATNASGASIAQTLTATGTTAGTATYTITPTANGCPGTPINVVITVNPIPVVTATPTSQTICSGTAPSIALTSNVAGTTFSWTVVQSGVTGATNASGATINQALTTTGTTTGTATYTITPTANGCPGTPIEVIITVNPSPMVTATPTSQTICSGTAPSIALTSNVTGTTFSWTVVQTGVTGATDASGASIDQTLTATGTTAGTATYTITPTANGCPGAPIEVVITVNPTPVVTATPTSQTICSGTAPSIALTSNVAGTTFSWTVVQTGVTGATDASGTSIAQTLTATGTTAGTATYTITPTANGCPGAPIEVIITVNPTPVVTATPTSQTICSGTAPSIALTSNVTGTTFNWTVVQSGVTGATNASGTSIAQTLTATGTTAGTATYTITPTANGCPGTPINVVITVNPIPVVTATPTSQTICSGTAPSIALTSNVTGTTFSWTVVQSGVTGATNGSGASIAQTLTATGTTAGTATYTITPTANGCPGTPINVVITVNPIPVVTATPTSQTICSGTAPSIALTSNVAGTTFSWTVVQSGVTGATNASGATINQTLTTTSTTAGTATYTITPTANGCPGAPIEVIITVNPTPVVTATPASQIICSGATTAIDLTSNVTGTTFSWTVVQTGVTGATNGSGASIAQTLTATGTTAGTATYTITPTANGCPGVPINVVVTVNPVPDLAPVANVAVCNTFTFPAIIGTNLTGTEAYYTGPNGTGTSFSPGQTFNTIGITTIYIYDETGTTPNCFDEASFQLTINPLPVIAGVGLDPSVCNATDGQIEVTLTSGSTSLGSLTWTGAASGTNPTADITLDSPDIDLLGAGSYNITFTDANGCVSNTVNVTLNNPGAPIINPISDYTSCNVDYELLLSNVTGTNLTTGLAFYSATGGNAADVIADGTIFTAPANITIYVYDENGACDAEIQFQVEINENPTAIISPDPAEVCFGGTITLNGNPAGGSGVYSSNVWTDDIAIINTVSIVNPNTLTSAAVGVYNLTYTVTDDNGCVGSDDIQVTINEIPTLSGIQDVCVGLTTTISSSGTPDATTPWSSFDVSIATVDNAGVVTGVAGGTTSISFLDASGCSNTISVTVNPNPVISLTPTDPSICNGTDGFITVNGTGTGTLNWAGSAVGTDSPVSLPYDITGLAAGTYDVTFTDANGCISNNPSTALNNPNSPIIDPIADTASCGVDFVVPDPTTFITGTDLTGNQAFYSATGGNAADLIPAGTIITAAMSPMTVFAYDINGSCDAEISFVVTVNENPTALISPDPAEACAGTSIALNGNPAGGSGVYSLNEWTGDIAILNDPTIVNPNTLTSVAAGSYNLTYTVTDDNGCIGSDNITIQINEVPVLSGALDVCVGSTTTLTSTGTPEPTGAWSSSDITIATVDNTGVVTGVSGGTADITFLDANGCSQSVTITVNENPVISLTPTDPTVCNSNDGFITVNGTGTGTVNWFGTATASQAGVTLPYDITNLEAGSYNITFVDAATGCTSNNPSTTLNNPGAPIIDAITDYTSCNIDYELLLSNVTGTNLTANLAFYDATGGPSGIGNIIADGTVFTAPTNTTVFVYDVNGACDAEIQFNIVINENPTALISPDPAEACFGTTIALSGNPTGGSGVYSSNTWTGNVAIIDNVNIVNPNTLTTAAAGVYNLTYTVTDNNGCVGTDDIQVTINPTPTATASNSGPLCDGLDFTLNETGGNATSWSWTSLNGSALFNNATLQSPTVSNVVDGEEFQITILDANGCANTTTTVVTVFSLPMVTPTNSSPVCVGEAIVLNETGGAATSWSWVSLNGSATFNNASLQSPTVSNAVNGEEFRVTIIDANGCSSVLSTIVTVNTLPTLDAAVTDISCFGANDGEITITPSGNGGFNYNWTPNVSTSNSATNLSAGSYDVVVIDANGCTRDTLLTITEPSEITYTISSTNTSCDINDGTATINVAGGTGNYTYTWSPVSGNTSTITNLGVGNYEVTVQDDIGCLITTQILIEQLNAPTLTFTNIQNVNCFGDANGSVDAIVNGGTPSYTYEWTPNVGNTGSVTNLTSGTYTLTVTDDAGCTVTNNVDISQPDALTGSAQTFAAQCGLSNGEVNLVMNGGTGPYSYDWSNGAITSSITDLISGNYSVIVTDANGCNYEETYIVAFDDTFTVEVLPDPISIELGESIQLTSLVNPTSVNLNYSWSPAEGLSCTDCPNPIASPTETTDYSLTVSTDDGCQTEIIVTVIVELPCTEVHIPNIFSPNGDGLNDEFCILGTCIRDMDLSIYNRWGERVFQSIDPEKCWDGVFRGEKVNAGVFVYKLEITNLDGEKSIISGNVSVIR